MTTTTKTICPHCGREMNINDYYKLDDKTGATVACIHWPKLQEDDSAAHENEDN